RSLANDDDDMPHVQESESEETIASSEIESSTSQHSGSLNCLSPPKASQVITFKVKCKVMEQT
ncbi:hypothetical protein L9F63_012953, partial [Diploptera punctata]